jgi:hypothetical protein
VQQWLSEQFIPLLFIGFSVLMGLTALLVSAKSRRSTLLRDRSGHTEDTFAEELAEHGYDSEIARATYRTLQERQKVAFPIKPMDDLDIDLGLDSDDVREVIQGLLAGMGRSYLPGLLDTPLVTVVDLVRTIQASPRREERVA